MPAWFVRVSPAATWPGTVMSRVSAGAESPPAIGPAMVHFTVGGDVEPSQAPPPEMLATWPHEVICGGRTSQTRALTASTLPGFATSMRHRTVSPPSTWPPSVFGGFPAGGCPSIWSTPLERVSTGVAST